MTTYIDTFRTLHSSLFSRYCSERRIDATSPVFLTHGANNVLYRVTIDKKILVCKIGINPSFRFLRNEFSIIKKLRLTRGFTDYFQDPETGIELLLLPFISGTHENSISKNQIFLLGRTIAAYHAGSRRISGVPVENATHFINSRILPVTKTFDNDTWYDRFHECGIMLAEKLKTAQNDSATPVLVHGDLIPGNIFFTPHNTIKIIDWEGARYDEPEADLATCIKGFKLTDAKIHCLLTGYGRAINHDTLHTRRLLHYLQVIAWRLAVQLKCEIDEAGYEAAIGELEEEFRFIEAGIGVMQGTDFPEETP